MVSLGQSGRNAGTKVNWAEGRFSSTCGKYQRPVACDVRTTFQGQVKPLIAVFFVVISCIFGIQLTAAYYTEFRVIENCSC